MRERGFTLIEMAIVLIIIGIVVTMSFDFTQDFMRNRRIQQTEVKLATIQEALVTYASQFRRLPCPADGTAATGQEDRTMNGTSVASCGTGTNANQARGVVPWAVLGLSQETAIDGWGNFISYRVEANTMPTSATTCVPVRSPAASEGMNLAGCDPTTAGAIAARLENVGFYVDRDTSTSTPDNLVADPRAGILTGAAYVLISHGENGWGAVSASGAVNTAPTDARELRNTAAAPATPGTGNAYVDGEPGSFDDLVRFATIMQVATRARLGPRAP